MLDRELVITIPGDPAPKGSLKCIGRRGRGAAHQLVEDNKASKPWRDKIVGWIRTKRLPATPDRYQPIGAEVTSTVARLDSHFGTGRNAGTLKPSAPVYPVTRSSYDVDKLLRLVLDALQDAKVLPDDAQVVEVTSRKVYPVEALDRWAEEPAPLTLDALPYPGVRIRLYPL